MKLTKTNYLHSGHALWLRGLLGGIVLPFLLILLLPAAASAADELGTVMIDGTSFYVLRTSKDWDLFKQIVKEEKGTKDVNAIMDADISTEYSVGLESDAPYRGIFDGNGYTLNVNITGSGMYYIAPFSRVKDATIKNLRVTGSVKGGMHAAGLIGMFDGSPEVFIQRVWVSANVTTENNRVGGFVGHTNDVIIQMEDCLFDGTLNANNASD